MRIATPICLLAAVTLFAGCSSAPHPVVGNWSSTVLPQGLSSATLTVAEANAFTAVADTRSGEALGFAGEWQAVDDRTVLFTVSESATSPFSGSCVVAGDDLTITGRDGEIAASFVRGLSR